MIGGFLINKDTIMRSPYINLHIFMKATGAYLANFTEQKHKNNECYYRLEEAKDQLLRNRSTHSAITGSRCSWS